MQIIKNANKFSFKVTFKKASWALKLFDEGRKGEGETAIFPSPSSQIIWREVGLFPFFLRRTNLSSTPVCQTTVWPIGTQSASLEQNVSVSSMTLIIGTNVSLPISEARSTKRGEAPSERTVVGLPSSVLFSLAGSSCTDVS